MRRWIALATFDESGVREPTIGDLATLDRVVVFTSWYYARLAAEATIAVTGFGSLMGDSSEPLAGDLATALDGFALHEAQEFLLVPLDAAHTVCVRHQVELERLWTGGPPA